MLSDNTGRAGGQSYVHTIAETGGAYAQAVANMDAGVGFAATALAQGRDREAVWNSMVVAIENEMAPFSVAAALNFLANLVAAVQLRLAETDSPNISRHPALIDGVKMVRALLDRHTDPLEAWMNLARRTADTCDKATGQPGVRALAGNVADGQILLAEQMNDSPPGTPAS
jgi:hypothetical protein